MKYYKILCLSIYILFFLSCARQSTPTGGPKDSLPPILVRTYPKQKQLNFKDNKVTLEFTEAIQILNAREQLLITPTMGKEFKATANKKTVTVEFDDNFKDSTTYTINFRDAVSDLTEKNPVKNLQLAFSTGTYIDSLSITGYVYDLFKNKEIKDATVALYQSDTFQIFKHKPTYITKTNEKGNFSIENLKPGTYHVYAFDDKNKNLIVDSKNESYGFSDKEYFLSRNVSNIRIPLIKLDARPLKLTSARPYNNYFNIRFAKNLASYSVTADSLAADSLTLTTSYGDDFANVKVYNEFKSIDSLKIKIHAIDSLGNTLDSAVYLKFNTKKVEPEKFTMTLAETKLEASSGDLFVKLKFSKPIKQINFDSLLYQRDTAQIFKFTKENLEWQYETNTLIIRKNIDRKLFVKIEEKDKPKETKPTAKEPAKPSKPGDPPAPLLKPKKNPENLFIIGKAVFISIDQDSTQKKIEQLKVLRLEDTGVLLTTAKTTEQAYITQVLTKDFKLTTYTTNKQDSKFENLPPTSYLLRLVIDKNNNGKWDPGNYFKQIEPEPIIYYLNEKKDPTINLKANWELGPLLIKY